MSDVGTESCPWAGDDAVYLDPDSDPTRAAAYRAHVAGCIACRAREESLVAIEQLARSDREAPPPVLGRRLLTRAHAEWTRRPAAAAGTASSEHLADTREVAASAPCSAPSATLARVNPVLMVAATLSVILMVAVLVRYAPRPQGPRGGPHRPPHGGPHHRHPRPRPRELPARAADPLADFEGVSIDAELAALRRKLDRTRRDLIDIVDHSTPYPAVPSRSAAPDTGSMDGPWSDTLRTPLGALRERVRSLERRL